MSPDPSERRSGRGHGAGDGDRRARTSRPRTSRDRSGLGGDRVEGRRAVWELLHAGRRGVHSVTLAGGRDRSEILDRIIELANESNVLINELPVERFDVLTKTDQAQGVFADADAVSPAELDDLLAAERPFLVALDGVTDPHNLGAILRTAETAGVTGVLLPRHRSAHLSPTAVKAAAGAVEYVPIALVAGIPQALERAHRAGVWSVGLDDGGDTNVMSLPLADGPIVVVLGAEGRGLARLTRERCELIASIPMRGNIASLNVSAAAAIALHAIAARRVP